MIVMTTQSAMFLSFGEAVYIFSASSSPRINSEVCYQVHQLNRVYLFTANLWLTKAGGITLNLETTRKSKRSRECSFNLILLKVPDGWCQRVIQVAQPTVGSVGLLA